MSDTGYIRGVALPGRAGSWELTIESGRVSALRELPSETAAALALPAFSDLHLHADRAYTYSGSRPESLNDAVEQVRDLRRRQQPKQVQLRAERLFANAISHGTLRARSHVDVDDDVRLRAIEGVLAAGAAMGGCMELEVVAFATDTLDPKTPHGRSLLADAVAAGADLLGAAPARFRDPGASIGALLDLAVELGVDVDLHLDESSHGYGMQLGALAEMTLDRGLNQRVTASHCCELAAAPNDLAARTISRVAEAEMTVLALPALNLYLQDRGVSTPRRRGLTAVNELASAGVRVLVGTDNVEDVFYPYGTADPLDSALLLSIVGHVDEDEDLVAATCGGKRQLEPGDRADVVVIDAASLREALVERSRARTIIRRGIEVRPPHVEGRPTDSRQRNATFSDIISL